jgi:hypothetical protein
MANDDEQVTLISAESGASRVFILVRRNPPPLVCHIEPTRLTATVLIAIGRNDDRIVRPYRIVYYECTRGRRPSPAGC